jgi:acyl carrier protein
MPEINTVIESDQVRAVVHEVVRLIAPFPQEAVTDEQQLVNHLSFHSLALAELGFTLEDLFGLDAVTPEQAMSMSTVGAISALICKAVANNDATLPSVADISSFCERYGAVWDPRA